MNMGCSLITTLCVCSISSLNYSYLHLIFTQKNQCECE